MPGCHPAGHGRPPRASEARGLPSGSPGRRWLTGQKGVKGAAEGKKKTAQQSVWQANKAGEERGARDSRLRPRRPGSAPAAEAAGGNGGTVRVWERRPGTETVSKLDSGRGGKGTRHRRDHTGVRPKCHPKEAAGGCRDGHPGYGATPSHAWWRKSSAGPHSGRVCARGSRPRPAPFSGHTMAAPHPALRLTAAQ